MRLTKPGSQPISLVRDFFNVNIHGRRAVLIRIVLVGSLLAALVLVGLALKKTIQPGLSDIERENPADRTIRLYKDSKDINDMRSVSAAYGEKGEDDKAVAAAKEVANQSQKTLDYIDLLRACTGSNQTDKQACIDDTVGKLHARLGSLSFFEAYIIGGMLDNSGQKKAAIDFYQKAYDIYDANKADEYMMTKDKLKSRIDELRR